MKFKIKKKSYNFEVMSLLFRINVIVNDNMSRLYETYY